MLILLVCCLYSFLGNAALQGPGPYITTFTQIFGVTQSEASDLISYPNLAYGFGSLLLVPMYMKFGRRPVMLGSMLIVCRKLPTICARVRLTPSCSLYSALWDPVSLIHTTV